MKQALHIIILLLLPLTLPAQSIDQNYILNRTYLTADGASYNDQILYFDGLARPVQTVQKGITPTGKDLIDITEYDGAGRTYRQWLPAAATVGTGAFVVSTTFKTSLASTQYAGDANPYAETILENSPLSRTLGQRNPGAVWNAHPTGVSYQANGSEVLYFYVNSSNQLQRGDNYSLNTLYKTIATDEDGKAVTEYRDKLGQVVMKRSSSDVDTYYAYNHLGKLSYVLPPNFVAGMGSTTSFSDDDALLKQFAYLYQYDERGNNTVKRLPGCDYIYMVYDKANRLVMSQDGNQRLKTQWTVNKYDALGRVIYIGVLTNASTRDQLKPTYDNSVVTEGYTLGTGYTCTNFCSATPLTINYYDSYNFTTFITNGSSFNWTIPPTGYDAQYLDNTGQPNAKGLLTGTLVYHLNDQTKYEVTALYYDDRGRVVQTRASNHMFGYDITYNAYYFSGKTSKTFKTHGINGAYNTYQENYAYTYDKAQRLLTTTHQLNGGSVVTLASNTYDELGRLTTKNLGGIDATTYTYNIRNWTTGINGNRFTENLYYNANTANLSTFTACYNGNIAGMQWSVPSESLGYNRAYTFVYDALNRLTDANYCGVNGSVVAGTTGKYDEHFTFDRMGNFNSLLRIENGSMINNLSFAYTGNQLKKVDQIYGAPYIPYGSEAFNDKQKIDTEYSYDQNGSTTSDVNTGISTIQYNLLNLPDIIQFTAGHKNLYTYDASGRKLEAINYTVADIINVPIGTISSLPDPSRYTKLTTDYVGNMIYENGALKEILLPDGYYQGGVYYYYLKDHLGDNRVVINSSGTVMEKSHYYPSGMRFYPESTSNSAPLPYRYNGKEMEAMNGLNQYDYGARRRGAGLPVWTAVDPLAEMYYSVSPYTYCNGNPVNRVDPNGMDSKNPSEIKNIDEGPNQYVDQNNRLLSQRETQEVDYLLSKTKNDNKFGYYTADANKSNKTVKKNNTNSLTAALVVGVESVEAFFTATELLVGGFMATVFLCPGDTPIGRKQEYKPAPADLPGFPGSQRTKPKAGRARWNLPNGDIGEWDSQHGEVEVYDKTGKKHKGAYDPKSGEKKKDGDPKRKTEPK